MEGNKVMVGKVSVVRNLYVIAFILLSSILNRVAKR